MHVTRTRRLTTAAAAAALFLSACSGAKSPQAAGPSEGPGGSDEVVADATTGASASASASAAATASASATSKPGAVARPGATGGSSAAVARPGTPSNPGTGTTTRTDRSVTLYTGADNTTGITNDRIVMCAHAALTYGAAFNTSKEDFNVYWTAVNEEQGGIFGRKVDVTYENDNYTPQDAITAATNCKAKNPFMIIGGIGFDQIPAVRNWAEDNKQLYMHHAATVKGSAGKRFSYTALPTVEKLGEMFAELAVKRFKGKKIAIMHRDSVNWDPGYDAFKALAKAKGLTIVSEVKTQNDHNHLQRVLTVKDSGADVVWLWENALVSTEVVTTADQQDYHPTWMAFPFNLTTQTLADANIDADMVGIAAWPAYSYKDVSGPFAPYAEDIRQFEIQYAKYRSSADLRGVGGDLLFLNWVAQKALHQMFLACGKDCTRNKFASLMHNGFKLRAQGCLIDFSRNPYRGGYQVNVFDTYNSPSGKRNWRPQTLCVEHL